MDDIVFWYQNPDTRDWYAENNEYKFFIELRYDVKQGKNLWFFSAVNFASRSVYDIEDGFETATQAMEMAKTL